MESTDATLMERVRAGDHDAFSLLVDRHKDLLVNYLTRITGNRERAEDSAQETFVRLFENAAKYRERGTFRAYLLRIATNLVRSEERRRNRWRLLAPLLASSNGHVEEAGQARRLLQAELHRVVAGEVSRLPLEFRVPLVLREIEGCSYEEIACVTGTRQGTVKSRIHRAKQRLREKLRPYLEGVER